MTICAKTVYQLQLSEPLAARAPKALAILGHFSTAKLSLFEDFWLDAEDG
jgi:hypothetical protein